MKNNATGSSSRISKFLTELSIYYDRLSTCIFFAPFQDFTKIMSENIKKIKIKRPRNGRGNNKVKKKSKNFMEMEVIKLRKQNGKCLQREMPRIQ